MVTLITEEADALQSGTYIERKYIALCRYIVSGSRGGAQNNQGGANIVQLSMKKSHFRLIAQCAIYITVYLSQASISSFECGKLQWTS